MLAFLRQSVSIRSRHLSNGVANYLKIYKYSTDVHDDELRKFSTPRRLHGNTESVWIEFDKLALTPNLLDLGAGLSNEPGYLNASNILAKVAKYKDPMAHQNTRSHGHPRLVNALGELYSQLMCRKLNPFTDILVTAGAFEGIFSSIVGHIDRGDEVIIIEPAFETYEAVVNIAEGCPCFIPLQLESNSNSLVSGNEKKWLLNFDELDEFFNEKTKMIILNNPHNPTGKVFTREEMERIANLCCKWNTICLTDEVYEWMVYDNNVHTRMCTLPGMWNRTITISSISKTYSLTGWRVGWAIGPSHLLANLKSIHENLVSSTPILFQEATAIIIETEIKKLGTADSYLENLSSRMQNKRDLIIKNMVNSGLKPIIPEATMFLLANWKDFEQQIDLSLEHDKCRDFKFTKWLIKNLGLLTIPTSPFACTEHKPLFENFIRFCFARKDEDLNQLQRVVQGLEKYKGVPISSTIQKSI